MLSTRTFSSIGHPATALLVLISISSFAIAQGTKPPQDQVDAFLKAEIEQKYELYEYRNAEISTTLIPGTLEYQIEFKATVFPKRDICVKVPPPSEVVSAKTELLKGQGIRERASMLRVSLWEQLARLPAEVETAADLLNNDISKSFYEIMQPAAQSSLLYGKCLADRTVDLWNFSSLRIIKEIGINHGGFAPSDAIVLNTPQAAPFIRTVAEHGNSYSIVLSQLTAQLTKEEEQQGQIKEPVSDPVRMTDAPPDLIPFLSKLLQDNNNFSSLEPSHMFSDPVRMFFGRSAISRTEVAEYYLSQSKHISSSVREAQVSLTRVYLVEAGSRYFVRMPYHFDRKVDGIECTGTNLLLAEVSFKNGKPEGIDYIDIQPIDLTLPFSAYSLARDREMKEETEAEREADKLASPAVQAPDQPPSTAPVGNRRDHVESYTARLSSRDHYNSNGTRLHTAAEIIRQDRANYYVYSIRDREDEPDSYFSSKQNRVRLQNLLENGNISPDAARTIINGTPLIQVEIDSSNITVTILSN